MNCEGDGFDLIIFKVGMVRSILFSSADVLQYLLHYIDSQG